jgi:hypothetical protein
VLRFLCGTDWKNSRMPAVLLRGVTVATLATVANWATTATWRLWCPWRPMRPWCYSAFGDLCNSGDLGIEPRQIFWGPGLCLCNFLFNFKQLWPWRLSSIVLCFRGTGNSRTENRTQDIFQSFYLPMFSSWSQGISMPSLVQIGASVLEL